MTEHEKWCRIARRYPGKTPRRDISNPDELEMEVRGYKKNRWWEPWVIPVLIVLLTWLVWEQLSNLLGGPP